MPIPTTPELTLPALTAAAAAPAPLPLAALRDRVATDLALTAAELAECLPSNTDTVWRCRIIAAIDRLRHAGLLERPSHGIYAATAAGRELLAQKPDRIDQAVLKRYPGYAQWAANGYRLATEAAGAAEAAPTDDGPPTPEEALDAAVARLDDDLAAELVERILAAPPDFLERVIVELLTAMGYKSSKRIVLMDGDELARRMIRHGVGVRVRATHVVRRADEEYFVKQKSDRQDAKEEGE